MLMRHTYSIPLALLLAFAPAAAYAQSHPSHKDERPQHLMFEGDADSVGRTLKENAPAHYNIPGLPRFAIFGKEGKFYLGIGGAVKATASYDFGNPVSNPNEFATSAIPMDIAPGNGARFRASAQQSSIFVNFVALPGSDNQIGAFVSMNFIGDNYTPSLQQAYLTYRGIKAGYSYGLFCDLAAGVPTIDYEGPNSFTSIPNAYIQYSWAKGSGWLRLAAMVRNLYYRDLSVGSNVDKVGWGINLSGSSPVAGGLTAFWQAVYGKGITSYFQDLNGAGMDLLPDPHNSGVLNTVKSWGSYLGLQYTFSPKVFCSATYSHVRTYVPRYGDQASSASGWDAQYKYAQYAVANIFWNITPILQTGLEYIYGRRVDYSGAQAHDNRIQTMLQLSF